MNARLFDEGIVEAKMWYQKLMINFLETWMGNRMRQEEVDYGDSETPEDLYGQEDRPAAEEYGSDFEDTAL